MKISCTKTFHPFYQLKLYVLTTVCSLFFLSTGFSQQTVWLLKNPELLTIYNRFEQRQIDLSTWQLYTPVILLNDADFLSDGFTKVIQIQYHNQPYFLQLTHEQKLGNIRQVFRNSQWSEKKVQLKKQVILELSAYPGNQPEIISEGSFLRIAFRNGNRLYAQSTTTHRWGWVTVSLNSESAFFKEEDKLVTVEANEGIVSVYNLLQTEIQTINQVIKKISEIKGVVTYPQIVLVDQRNKLSISWTDENKNEHWMSVKQSLFQRIETILLGSGFKINDQISHWVVEGQRP